MFEWNISLVLFVLNCRWEYQVHWFADLYVIDAL
jgi:hypothetical protein